MEELIYREKSWFSKIIISLELILSHFFTSNEFSCDNFTDQIFILGQFQSAKGDNGPHPDQIQSGHSLGRLTSYFFSVFRANPSSSGNRYKSPHDVHFHCAFVRHFWPKLAWGCVIHWENWPPIVKPYLT